MKKILLTALMSLLVVLGIHTSIAMAVEPTTLAPEGAPVQGKGWELTAISGPSEIALAKHLKKTGAIVYGAYWCPHCYEQDQLFGKEAATTQLVKVECSEDGENTQRDRCKKAKITGFPTWIIKGKKYPGVQTPEKLAKLTRYRGPMNFKYSKLLQQ
jgi:glutaredoxin